MISQDDLRMACNDLHRQAEQTAFSQSLIHGTVTPAAYKQMCWQMYLITDFLEKAYPLGYTDLERRQHFALDAANVPEGTVSMLNSTNIYLGELQSLRAEQLRGHVYTFYLSWLYGGQMLKKKLKHLPTSHLDFHNAKACIDHVRSIILKDIAMADADQAQKAFQAVMEIYNELHPAD